MKIVILGAGGVGGYFGARLASAGSQVTFVARGEHLTAMRRTGLRLTSGLGDMVLHHVNAVESIEDAGDADLVVVCVKLWETEAVARSLRPITERGAAIVSLQNGVQKEALLRMHVPHTAIVGGVCYIAASIAEPGAIAHSGTMQKIVVGEFSQTDSTRCADFVDDCRRADIDAEVSADIERTIWEKFVMIVGASATTSMYRTTIGAIRDDREMRATLLSILQEAVAVGRAEGVRLAEDFARDRLAFLDGLPPGMRSSMALDLERGNRLELPWLSGGVVALGAARGVATPANQRVVDALTPFVPGTR